MRLMNLPPIEFAHANHRIVLTQFVSKYDGCVMTVVRIDNTNYPHAHRSEQGARAAAVRIINNLK